MPVEIKEVTLYSVDEVALVLGNHRNTILKKINEGQINVVFKKKGESFYVERDELERLCQEYAMPSDMIEYRLGIKSPKTGRAIA